MKVAVSRGNDNETESAEIQTSLSKQDLLFSALSHS